MLVSYQNLQVGISYENLDGCPVLLRMESLKMPESPTVAAGRSSGRMSALQTGDQIDGHRLRHTF